MSSLARRLVLLSVLPLALAGFAAAQQPSASAPITIDAVVTDKSGPPVPNLPESAFTLLDNKSPRALSSFKALSGKQSPVEVILLIDAVNINFDRVAFARSQLERFLKANGGHLAYPTSVAVFTDTGTQIQPGFSTDGNAIAAALDKNDISLRILRRSAGFYGATERLQLSLTCMHQLIAVEAHRPGRKLIVWISPGWPYLSGPGIQLDNKERTRIFSDVVSLSTQLRLARITIYSVDPIGAGEGLLRSTYYESFEKGVKKPGDVDLANLSLQVLATQSGGLAITSNNDITAGIARCVADANAFYELTFNPPPAEKPNEYHHLELKVAQPGLTARTRDGYYLQP